MVSNKGGTAIQDAFTKKQVGALKAMVSPTNTPTKGNKSKRRRPSDSDSADEEQDNRRAHSTKVFDRLGSRGPISSKAKKAHQVLKECKEEAQEARRQELLEELNSLGH